VRLEPVPGGGVTVPDVVRDVAALGVPQHDLVRRLAQAGYLSEHSESYAGVRYEVRERHLYAVEPGFPRIVPSSFIDGSTPTGVMRLTYVVDLTNQPPVPLTEREAARVYREVAEALS